MEGDRWEDGCQYKCECLDATNGRYRCDEKYVDSSKERMFFVCVFALGGGGSGLITIGSNSLDTESVLPYLIQITNSILGKGPSSPPFVLF